MIYFVDLFCYHLKEDVDSAPHSVRLIDRTNSRPAIPVTGVEGRVTDDRHCNKYKLNASTSNSADLGVHAVAESILSSAVGQPCP